MNLCTSVFAYLCSIGLYKCIVNADTQSIRIANADGQGIYADLVNSKKRETANKISLKWRKRHNYYLHHSLQNDADSIN